MNVSDNSLPISGKIPGLYETENVPLEEKIIHRHYYLGAVGFEWLIAELDPEEKLAFGYANLNDDEMAEWGLLDVSELLSNGAALDRDWKPCKFSEAKKRIFQEKSPEPR